MNDTRTYFFTPEGDDRLRLHIVTSDGIGYKMGIFKTRESAIRRLALQAATEVEILETFTTYKAPEAPVLRVFASAVAGVTR